MRSQQGSIIAFPPSDPSVPFQPYDEQVRGERDEAEQRATPEIGSALLLLLRGARAVRDRGDDGDLVALAHDALGEVLLDRDGVVVGLDAGVDFLRTLTPSVFAVVVHGHLGELGGALGGRLRQVGGGLLVDAQVVVVRLVPLVLVRLVPGRVRVRV